MSLSQRTVLMLLGADVLFSVLFTYAYSYLMGASVVAVAACIAAVSVVRLLMNTYGAARLIRPSELIHARSSKSRAVTPEALRRAEVLLQRVPGLGSMTMGMVWFAQVPLLTAVAMNNGVFALQGGLEVTNFALMGVGGLGASAICYPLLDWVIAPLAGDNSILARKLDVELDRPARSIPTRIMLMSFSLCSVPVLFMTALGYTTHMRDMVERAGLETELISSSLESGHGDPASLENAARSPRFQGRVTTFALDASGELRTVGEPAPAWLTASWAGKTAKGVTTNPERGTFARAVASSNQVVGVAVRVDTAGKEFVAIALVVMITLAFWGPLCGWLLARTVAVPLDAATTATRRIAEEGDLSKMGSLAVPQQDEVGLLVSNINVLLDTMRELAEAAAAVGNGNLDIPISGHGELPDAFRQMVKNLREVVDQMHGTAAELGSAATEIFAASQEQEAAATSHSSGMVEITETMVSLSRSAAHVADSVQGVLQNAERTLENTDQMVGRIGALSTQANRIGNILDAIREIADRSDLLALNGSLEATRAGESGRGFALVAAEMRRLAERVTGSVEDIKLLVGEIREAGASTVLATEESKKVAQKTMDAARNITLVTQQQRTSTEQVTQSVRSIADVVSQAAAATVQTRSSAEGLKLHAERLASLVQRFQLHG